MAPRGLLAIMQTQDGLTSSAPSFLIRCCLQGQTGVWIPACAGMTVYTASLIQNAFAPRACAPCRSPMGYDGLRFNPCLPVPGVWAMDLNEDDVIQILRYLDESKFNELQLQLGDLRIVVNRTGSSPPQPRVDQSSTLGPSTPAPTQPPAPPLAPHPGEETPTASPAASGHSPSGEEEATDRGQRITITAPMLGTFYRAPSPGEPPFVEEGSVVDEDTTVCIIEVMKLFSTIKAEKRGRVARVSVEDGQLVEYGQVLFLLEPEGI